MERQAKGCQLAKRISARIQYELKDSSIGKRYFYKILESMEPNYAKTSINTEIVEALILYALGFESFINGKKVDPLKGIALIGNTGSGKTVTMRALYEYMLIDEVKCIYSGRIVPFYFTRFELLSTIQGIYNSKGYDGIEPYFYGCNIVIDDVKADQLITKHYGNDLNVFSAIVEERYSRGVLTSFTSNLGESQINDFFNDRTYSRVMERTNIIEMVDNDWRLLK